MINKTTEIECPRCSSNSTKEDQKMSNHKNTTWMRCMGCGWEWTLITDEQREELMEKHGVKNFYTSLFCRLCGSEETTTVAANKEAAHIECDNCRFDWVA